MASLDAKDTLVKADFTTLNRLRNEIRDDVRRWPKCPLKDIDGLIEKYIAALSEERTRRLFPWGVNKRVNLVLRRRDSAAELRAALTAAKEWIQPRLKR